ncbi:MAG TPA: LysR family transcriptional regulator [Caulobacter sp.]|nr:LysR family transcriptional regulator [Caulobacter sp.]
MRLRHIEVFHAVYAHGSISTAARTLNVSQPSVSKVLKHAEDQLGFRLFRRVKGRLAPTDEAHALFREVKEVFERLDSLKQAARNLKLGEGGHIRAAVLPALGLSIAPAAVARFRAKHPTVTFDFRTLHYDEVLRSLYEHEVDMALAYDSIQHPRVNNFQIGSGELMMMFRRGEFGEDPGPRLDLKSLESRNYIGSGATGPVSDIFSAEVEDRGLVINEPITVSTFYMAAALVRHGVGVAVVDEFTARAEASELIDFRPLEPTLAFGVYCMHLEDRPLSQLSESFVKVMRDVLEEVRGLSQKL